MTLQPTRPSSADAESVEVLFREAHRRRRRRRVFMAAVVAVAVAGTTAGLTLTGNGSSHSRPPVATPKVQQPAVKLPGTPPRVAWADYQGNVHIGSLQTHEQRVVASGATDPVSSLVVSGTKLLWVHHTQAANTVMAYDTVTGRVRPFASGAVVFNAVGSTDVFVDLNDPDSFESLARYDLSGKLLQSYTYPAGWYLFDTEGLGTSSSVLANGQLLLRTLPAPGSQPALSKPLRLAVWTPATGQLRVLGDTSFMVATYTDAGTGHSLIAWLPWTCATLPDCRLQLTDLASGVTRRISSPLGFGFDMRGGFSAGGRRLAAFARTNSGGYNPETRLALIDVATGSLRLVPGATIEIGEGVAWAQWLPGTDRLMVGGNSRETGSGKWIANHFLVDAATLRATPFAFLHDGNQDVNYSAVLLP
jgi:hypothetical protein